MRKFIIRNYSGNIIIFGTIPKLLRPVLIGLVAGSLALFNIYGSTHSVYLYASIALLIASYLPFYRTTQVSVPNGYDKIFYSFVACGYFSLFEPGLLFYLTLIIVLLNLGIILIYVPAFPGKWHEFSDVQKVSIVSAVKNNLLEYELTPEQWREAHELSKELGIPI